MLQDLLLDNPRHGVCQPTPLTTTSRDRGRTSSLRLPLPEAGRPPRAQRLPPLSLTQRTPPSWLQHHLVTGGGNGEGRSRSHHPTQAGRRRGRSFHTLPLANRPLRLPQTPSVLSALARPRSQPPPFLCSPSLACLRLWLRPSSRLWSVSHVGRLLFLLKVC